MAGIGVVLNTKAGKKKFGFRGHAREKLAFLLGDLGCIKETKEIEEIEEVANFFCDRDVDILGIVGGDGSNHYILDTFLKVYKNKPLPKVALLCGGTHNAHALSIGVKGPPDRLLQNIVHKQKTQENFTTTQRILIQVDDGQRVHYGFTMASGFMNRFYEELIEKQNDSAMKVATLLGSWVGSFVVGGQRIREIFALEPAHVRAGNTQLDWTSINGFSASSMEKLGLGFTPYALASKTPTTFHAGVLRIEPGAFIRLLWDYKRGVVPKHPDTFTQAVDILLIESEKKISYVFDGELFTGTEKMKITSGPSLDLIVL
jgi:diacylglycerol kinase family enzyme